MTENTSDQERKEYFDELKYVREGERDANQTLDKALLALSGAAFGLSLTISHDLIPANSRPQEHWLLFISWLALAVSLTSTLISFRSSISSWRREGEYLNQRYETGKEAPENQPSTLTSRLNDLSLAACLIGIVCFAAFVWLNLPR